MHATLFDLTGWTRLRAEGRDARTFLHNFCTAEIKKLPAGGVCEAFFTNVKARVVGHGFVIDAAELDGPPRLDVFASPGQATPLLEHLERYLIREEVALSDRSAETTTLYFVGDGGAERLAAAGLTGGLRLDLLGMPGLALDVPARETASIVARLERAGVTVGDAAEFEALRLSAAFPLFGVDLTDGHLAPEAGRPWAISYTKGCYLGQEPIARIDALGHVNRLLRGLRIDGPVPQSGTPVLADGKEIGRVSSAAPCGAAAVALATLRAKSAEPGTAVTVSSPEGEAAATVFAPAAP